MAVVDLKPKGDRLDQELAGLDALEQPLAPKIGFGRRLWAATWPKLVAIGIALGLWQLVVWSGWRPEYVLPSPFTVLDRLWADMQTGQFWEAVWITMRRAAWGFFLSVVVGFFLGVIVAKWKPVRAAFGSLLTGLQTMPSIAWFPLAILLFQLSESAILFVVVLGAAPSIANGFIHGVDHIPPIYRRVGRVLGAKGPTELRHVVVPAAMPDVVAGLKQGWAFAWRSLMAGELIVVIANSPSIGQLLQVNREFSDSAGLLAVMLAILAIGILIDVVFFGTVEKRIRRRRGLGDA